MTTRQTGPRPTSGEQFEIHRGTAAGAAKAVVGQVVAAVLRDMQLDITEVGRYTAIHGLLRNTGYAATEQSADSVTLAASIYPQHGYLFNRVPR
ncbi:MAG: hypothetical protein M3Y77_01390 [Actinomycetota bacterium]|nr:hypothetical protein [Actinomycetota bacterium]